MNGKQSRRASLAEVVVNTSAGFFISLVAQRIIFPMYGIHVDYATDVQIVLLFTLISIARSYLLRRAWNCEWWKRLPHWRVATASLFAYAAFNPYR